MAACASSRFEFELFSGTVTGEPQSEAQNADESLLSRVFQRGVVQANHELVVRSPEGESRTFRVGTTTAQLPAQVRDLALRHRSLNGRNVPFHQLPLANEA